jgi:hypothetical protein
MDVVIRPAVTDDLEPIAEIYAHHVLTGVATFEVTPPDPDEWRRFDAATERELPFVTAALDGKVVGYGFCAHGRRGQPIATPSKIRFTWRPARSAWASAASCSTPCSRAAPVQAFGKSSPSLSIRMVRLLLHCAVIADSSMPAGWLDTLLLQRSIGEVTD